MTSSTLAFGNYRLLDKIGEGPIGEVFLAVRDEGTPSEQVFALKRVHTLVARDPAVVRGFLQGAARARKLVHPSLVQVVDHGEQQGVLFVVTEYREAFPLHRLLAQQRLRRQPFAPEEVIFLMLQLCEALQVAHRAQADRTTPWPMVHGDLKPSNILVSTDGLATLLDLGTGLAGLLDPEGPLVWMSRESLRFLAPEQVRGGEPDVRSDVYALGALMFELLTLEPFIEPAAPFTMLRTITEIDLAERLRLLKELNIEGELARVVSGALQRKPKARFPDAGALADALSELDLSGMQNPAAHWRAIIASLDSAEEVRVDTPALHLVTGDSGDSIEPWDLSWSDNAFCTDAVWLIGADAEAAASAAEAHADNRARAAAYEAYALEHDRSELSSGGIMLLDDAELDDTDDWDEHWNDDDLAAALAAGEAGYAARAARAEEAFMASGGMEEVLAAGPADFSLEHTARMDRLDRVQADEPLVLRAEDLEDTAGLHDDDQDDEYETAAESSISVDQMMHEKDFTAFEIALAKLQMRGEQVEAEEEPAAPTFEVTSDLDDLRDDGLDVDELRTQAQVELEARLAEEERQRRDEARKREEESSSRPVLTGRDLSDAFDDFMTTALPDTMAEVMGTMEAGEEEGFEIEAAAEEDDDDSLQTAASLSGRLDVGGGAGQAAQAGAARAEAGAKAADAGAERAPGELVTIEILDETTQEIEAREAAEARATVARESLAARGTASADEGVPVEAGEEEFEAALAGEEAPEEAGEVASEAAEAALADDAAEEALAAEAAFAGEDDPDQIARAVEAAGLEVAEPVNETPDALEAHSGPDADLAPVEEAALPTSTFSLETATLSTHFGLEDEEEEDPAFRTYSERDKLFLAPEAEEADLAEARAAGTVADEAAAGEGLEAGEAAAAASGHEEQGGLESPLETSIQMGFHGDEALEAAMDAEEEATPEIAGDEGEEEASEYTLSAEIDAAFSEKTSEFVMGDDDEIEALSFSDMPMPTGPSTVDLSASVSVGRREEMPDDRQMPSLDGRREAIPETLQLPNAPAIELPSLGLEIEAFGAEEVFETLEAEEGYEIEEAPEEDAAAPAAPVAPVPRVTRQNGKSKKNRKQEQGWEGLKTPAPGVAVNDRKNRGKDKNRPVEPPPPPPPAPAVVEDSRRTGGWFRPVARRPLLEDGIIIQERYQIEQRIMDLNEKSFYEVSVIEADNQRMCYVCGYANNLAEDTHCYKCRSPLVPRHLNLSLRWNPRRIERELQLSQKTLEHRGLARVYDQFIQDGMLFRVLEPISGQLLHHLPETLDVHALLEIGFQSAQALEYLHSEGISCASFGPEHIYIHNGLVQLYDLDIDEVLLEGALPASVRVKDVMALARVLIPYTPQDMPALVAIMRDASGGRIARADQLSSAIEAVMNSGVVAGAP